MATAAAISTTELEFITLVRVDGFTGDYAALAADVEVELVRILADEGIAAIVQYFARPVSNGVQVGLRFRGMLAGNAQSTAEEVVIDAVNAALVSEGAADSSGRMVSSMLAGA